MSEFNRLRLILGKHFQWHGARLTLLAQFLVAVIRVGSVNLSQLSTAFVGKTLVASNYKRLQRFFREFRIDYVEFARSITTWIGVEKDWVVILDRTQWEFGNQMHNVLMLSIAYKGVALPLLWTFLANRSNSYAHQRKALLHRFQRIFPNQNIAYVTPDREFIGKDWWSYLVHKSIPFCIRIRECDHLYDGQRSLSPKVVFSNLQVAEIQILSKPRRIAGIWAFVVATRVVDGKVLVLITSRQPKQTLVDYAQTWQIETLFGCLKSRGFNLEATHISRRDRLSKMIALLTIALIWSLHTGQWQHSLQKLPPKKHGRPPISIFPQGLDFLRRALFNLDAQPQLFCQSLNFLSCT